MLTWLLVAGIALAAPSEDPHKATPPKHEEPKKEAAPKEEAKNTEKAGKASIAVPHAPKPAAEPVESKAEEPKPKPKPRPRPKPSIAKPAAEPNASKGLLEQNIKLQQELATRSGGLTTTPVTTPDAALAELMAGNQRFVDGRRVRTLMSAQDPGLRQDLSKGQTPHSVIVTCSDSRMVDNLIFDQELGRLFTIREAGNAPDIQGIASVEYAVEHLGSKLVVVLGHTSCGAIKAMVGAHGKPLPGNLWSLQAALAGLVEANHQDPNGTEEDYLHLLSRQNAVRQAQAILDRSEIVRHLVATGRLRVLPACYDLASGRVEWLKLEAAKAEAPAHH